MAQPFEHDEIIIIRAIDPASVVCPEVILVNALTTLGVPLSADPRLAYTDTREALPQGGVRRILQWTLQTVTADGRYKAQQLIAWWNDENWIKANPTHELAVLKVGSENLLRLATRIRLTPHIAIFRRGRRLAMIPSQLPQERREKILAEFEAES